MKAKAIACRVMEAELRALAPADTEFEIFEISEHVRPDQLANRLQEAVNRADGRYDPIYLGYGLCSKAVAGLTAHRSRLIVFRADDCIAIFLGSQQARVKLAQERPGSYFLSRGWIDAGAGSIFDEYARMEKRWGAERAGKLFRKMLEHYTQLTHIALPGAPSLEADRSYAREKAAQFKLEYVEIAGTLSMMERLFAGQECAEIAVFAPGEPITLEAMRK